MANLLIDNDSGFEGGLGTWKSTSPFPAFVLATVTSSVVAPDTGTKCLRIAWKNKATSLSVSTAVWPQGVQASPSTAYTLTARARSAGTGRSFTITVTWYNAVGTSLGTGTNTVTDSSSAWTTNTVNVTSPAGTAYAVLTASWSSVAEDHYLDTVGLMTGSSQPWAVGVSTSYPGISKPSILTLPNQTYMVGEAVVIPNKASSTSATITSWSALALPTGLSINATTGVISGTCTTAGSYFYSVTATDSSGAQVAYSSAIYVLARKASTTNWPGIGYLLGFNPSAAMVDATAPTGGGVVKHFDFKRGRQYELGQAETGEGSVVHENLDGRYTPVNSSGPYYTFIQPMVASKLYFTTGASTTTPMYAGFVNRWPLGWEDEAGNQSVTETDIVDGFAVLGRQTLQSAVDFEQKQDSPFMLIRMDGEGPTLADIINPGSNPTLAIYNRKQGAGTINFGASMGVVDQDVGVEIVNAVGSVVDGPASVLGFPKDYNPIPNGEWTITCAIKTSNKPASGGQAIIWILHDDNGGCYVYMYIDSSGHVNVTSVSPNGSWTINDSTVVTDGQLRTVSLAMGASGQVASIYVNGSRQSLFFVTTAAQDYASCRYFEIGGIARGTANFAPLGFNGSISRLAFYNSEVQPDSQVDHYNAIVNGFAGETSDARVHRILDYAGWPYHLRDLDAGMSTMGPATSLEGTSGLDALLSVVDDEQGMCYIAGNGKVRFKSRTFKFKPSTAAVTFGENVAGGEIPYVAGTKFDFDLAYVFNRVNISREGGISTTINNSASQAKYGVISTDVTTHVNSDAEAVDRATFLASRYSDPQFRVENIVIEAHSYPTAFLNFAEIGTRVDVVRRPLGQPSFTLKCFVESVQFEFERDHFIFTYELSPIPPNTYWILDDATYSVLGTTTRLGF